MVGSAGEGRVSLALRRELTELAAILAAGSLMNVPRRAIGAREAPHWAGDGGVALSPYGAEGAR
jgi:hypothetical protein